MLPASPLEGQMLPARCSLLHCCLPPLIKLQPADKNKGVFMGRRQEQQQRIMQAFMEASNSCIKQCQHAWAAGSSINARCKRCRAAGSSSSSRQCKHAWATRCSSSTQCKQAGSVHMRGCRGRYRRWEHACGGLKGQTQAAGSLHPGAWSGRYMRRAACVRWTYCTLSCSFVHAIRARKRPPGAVAYTILQPMDAGFGGYHIFVYKEPMKKRTVASERG